jgi:hypothetical protein
MAVEGSQPFKITLQSSVDMRLKQYTFVKVNSAGKAALCTAATDVPVGVLQNKPVTNGAAEITVIGETKVYADAITTAGDLIGTSSDGQADPKTPGTDTTEYVVGQVKIGAGAAGQVATAIVNCAAPARGA